MRAAIATLAIGADYQGAYARIFRPSVQRYAARHGYDLLLFDRYLGPPAFHEPDFAHLMKLLLPAEKAVQGYERLLVLDVDILVHSETPPFHRLEIDDGVGAVDEWSQPSRAERLAIQRAKGWDVDLRDYYARAGLVLESDTMLNSGMFVCSPARHAAFFRDVAERRFPARRNYPVDFHQYEQAVFNYELQTAGLVRLLPADWNRLWPLHRPRVLPGAAARLERFRSFLAVRESSFMLHLTGGQDHDFAFAARNR
jgi:hypothetical protein